jgi:hypothetical protein
LGIAGDWTWLEDMVVVESGCHSIVAHNFQVAMEIDDPPRFSVLTRRRRVDRTENAYAIEER